MFDRKSRRYRACSLIFLRVVQRRRVEYRVTIAEFQGDRARLPDRHRAVEARAPPGMASAGTSLLDLDPHRVLVAVDAHLDDALAVTGGLALAPQRPARAAEVPCLAGVDGPRERLGVHVRD